MKRLMYSVFIAFWSSVATIVVLGALSSDPVERAAGKARLVTSQELTRHNSQKDCWMAIDGKVYDLTGYVPKHPAPPSVILQWCGKDATEAFDTKGYGRPHSPAAKAMLGEYVIGELKNN